MNIWVTGAHGQVGRCLKALAADLGLVRFRFFGREELDVTSATAISRLASECPPAGIVNLAAYTNVDLAESEVGRARLINSHAPRLLAECANSFDVPIVHLSTDYVFDGKKNTAYLPSDPTNPLSEYGRSKLEGENVIKLNAKKHVIIRTSWIFSEYGTNFVKTIMRKAMCQGQLNVVDDQIGGPTFGRDLADVIIKVVALVDQPSFSFGTYHYSGHPFVSWFELASYICKVMEEVGYSDSRLKLAAVSSKTLGQIAPRPTNSCLDSAAMINLISKHYQKTNEFGNWKLGIQNLISAEKMKFWCDGI